MASSFPSLTLHCFGLAVKFAAVVVAVKVKDDSVMGLAV